VDWVDAVGRLRDAGEPGVLVTVVEVRGHAPRDAGAKMVVAATGSWGSVGGGAMEADALVQARHMLAEGAVEPRRSTHGLNRHAPSEHGQQCCGGVVELLLEPLPARPTVAVFGLGHVGAELARILSRLPIRLELVDSRVDVLGDEARADLDRGPATVRVHHAPTPETVLATLPADAHVLVLTHDHAEDLAICDMALRRPLGSIGVIGSSAKWSQFRRRLREAGHDEVALERIACPIGVPDIIGKQPALIAVSVAADLLRVLGKSVAGGLAR
jgi:xanthine dehydrogenase accessory factor